MTFGATATVRIFDNRRQDTSIGLAIDLREHSDIIHSDLNKRAISIESITGRSPTHGVPPTLGQPEREDVATAIFRRGITLAE